MPLEFDDNSLRLIGCNFRGLQFYDDSTPPVLKAEIYLDRTCGLVIAGETGTDVGSSTNPLTLTVSTTNSVTQSGHTHQILSSSNPGQSQYLLATDGGGELSLFSLNIITGGTLDISGRLLTGTAIGVTEASVPGRHAFKESFTDRSAVPFVVIDLRNTITSNNANSQNSLEVSVRSLSAAFQSTGNWRAIYGYAENRLTSGTTANFTGVRAEAVQNTSAAATLTELWGLEALASHQTASTVTNARAIRAVASKSGAGSGVLTTAYALFADVTLSGGGSIGTAYGLYIDPLAGTTAYGAFIASQTSTTAYGLYIENATTLALWVDSGKTRLDTAVTVASAAGATLDAVSIPADTITITGATNITTATGFNLVNIGISTYSAASALTITNAASLYVAGPPAGGGAGPATITNAYALWVDAGNVRLDTAVALGGGAAPTLGTIGGSGPATAAQNEWIRIDTQNGVRVVPAWA